MNFHRLEIGTSSWDVPNYYSDLCTMGSGAYGQVCSALDSRYGVRVAIKKLNRLFDTAIHAKRAYREIRMLKHMKHENVIGLLDLFSPAKELSDFAELYLVTHLMAADLNQIIRTQELTDEHVKFFIYQILRGLKYVHSGGVIHRDLKPGNIAVNEDCELKILDFGLARPHDQEMTGYVATRWYRAPEIMLNWMHYTQTADIWSVGCIMGEMLNGKVLFPGSDHLDQLSKIVDLVGSPNADFLQRIISVEARRYVEANLSGRPRTNFSRLFSRASAEAVDLLEQMLEIDPDKRPDAARALQHVYLSQYHDPDDEPTAELFNLEFENFNLPTDEWKVKIFNELHNYTARPPIDQENAE